MTRTGQRHHHLTRTFWFDAPKHHLDVRKVRLWIPMNWLKTFEIIRLTKTFKEYSLLHAYDHFMVLVNHNYILPSSAVMTLCLC